MKQVSSGAVLCYFLRDVVYVEIRHKVIAFDRSFIATLLLLPANLTFYTQLEIFLLHAYYKVATWYVYFEIQSGFSLRTRDSCPIVLR